MNVEIISNEQVTSLERIATIVAKSGMGGFKTPEQATVAMLLALAEGIPLGRVIHEYHVINGRLSLRSECMLARFQKAGGVIQYVTHTDTEVSVTASHPKGGALTVTWTIYRARKAGLTSNPTWTKHPAAMLTARAITEAVRAVYPACLSGIITEDEAVEITTPPTLNSNETHPLPGELTPTTTIEADAPREYVIRDTTPADRRPRPSRNGESPKRSGRTRSMADPETRPIVVVSHIPNTDTPSAPPTAQDCGESPAGCTPPSPAPEPEALHASAHQTAGEFNPEPESRRPSPHAGALYHPLDPVLADLDQDKLTAFLLKQAFITESQNYKWVGPNATSRILKQLPSFLRAAGLEAVTAA